MATAEPSGLLAEDDGLIHAARRRLNGHFAVCGAGRITTVMPGRFDIDGNSACPRCVRHLMIGSPDATPR